MGGTSLITVLTNLATLVTSTAGASFVIIAIALAAGYAAIHGHWPWVWSAIGGGGLLLSAAWFVTTVYGVAG